MKRKEAEDIRQTADVFDIRIAGLSKKAGFTLYRERPFFSHPIFRPTYMMLQVWEAGDQRESDGVVTALQARCGRTLDHQWGAKSCCGGSTKTSFKARSVRACYMLVGVPADVTKLLASCDAVGMPARQTLRAYISNLAKYPQVTSSSFILLFCSKPF